MRSLPAQKAAMYGAYCIVVFALGAPPKGFSFRQPVLTIQTQSPCEDGAACVPAPALFHAPATPDDPFFPQFIAPGALLIPPLVEEPSFSLTAPAPLVIIPEDTEYLPEAAGVEQKAPAADQTPQDTRVAELLQSQKEQEQRLAEHHRAIEKLVSTQKQLMNTLSILQKAADKKLSWTAIVKTLALTLSGICLLVTLCAFLDRGTLVGIVPALLSPAAIHRPSRRVPVHETAVKDSLHAAPPMQFHTENARMCLQIATRYLSTPKQEDVIRIDFAPHRYALVLADGASTYLCSGGEISGGGRQAAKIAADTTLTYLRRYLYQPLCLAGMLSVHAKEFQNHILRV